jgi:penicillin-binding protein 1A
VIRKITQNDSVLVDDRAQSTRVIDRSVAEKVNYALQQVVEAGSGSGAALPGQAQVWGKTGTTDEYGDAWFVGYTRQLTTAVWMGYPEGQSNKLLNIHGVKKVNGGSLPAQIFKRFMSKASPADATPPDKVPDLSGKTPAPVATVLSSGSASSGSSGSSSGGSSSASTTTIAPAEDAPPTTTPRQSTATVPPATVPTAPDPFVTTPTAPATTTPRPRTTFTIPTIPPRP